MAHTVESLLEMVPKTLPGDKAKCVDMTVQLNVTGSEAGSAETPTATPTEAATTESQNTACNTSAPSRLVLDKRL